MQRLLFLILGVVFVGLGVLGAFLPLLPTTVFLILAAGCFARSSPRLEAWLLSHARFGPTLRAWRESGAISARGKILASLGMALGYGGFYLGVHPRAPLALAVLAALGLCAVFVISRPAPPRLPGRAEDARPEA